MIIEILPLPPPIRPRCEAARKTWREAQEVGSCKLCRHKNRSVELNNKPTHHAQKHHARSGAWRVNRHEPGKPLMGGDLT